MREKSESPELRSCRLKNMAGRFKSESRTVKKFKVQNRSNARRVPKSKGSTEAGGIDEMMDPSIDLTQIRDRTGESIPFTPPPNPPFLSAFFVSKAQIPPSKAARFGLVYSFIRGLMRVRNLELSIKSAAFYTGN